MDSVKIRIARITLKEYYYYLGFCNSNINIINFINKKIVKMIHLLSHLGVFCFLNLLYGK